MKNICLIFLYFLWASDAFGQGTSPFEFKKIYSYALQGDVKKIINVLDTLPENVLTPEQKVVKEKYYQRFKFHNEVLNYPTADPLIIRLFNIYFSYWNNVLLDNYNLKKYDEQLKDSITSYLSSNNYTSDTLNIKDISKNFAVHLKKFLAQHKYYSATGKTGNFFDLFIWTEEKPKTYIEQLAETKTAATVIFLENTLTMGWEEYATFGIAYPGGWATKEVLYCVRKAYDTTSENFKISYLKHEAQHFADYKAYPMLTGADLEYRAKLTELIFAKGTLYNTIRTFIRNASKEGRHSHSYGNYSVVRDLSKELFKQDFVSDIEQWKRVSPRKINKTSKRLFKRHSKALTKAGAKTVTELI